MIPYMTRGPLYHQFKNLITQRKQYGRKLTWGHRIVEEHSESGTRTSYLAGKWVIISASIDKHEVLPCLSVKRKVIPMVQKVSTLSWHTDLKVSSLEWISWRNGALSHKCNSIIYSRSFLKNTMPVLICVEKSDYHDSQKKHWWILAMDVLRFMISSVAWSTTLIWTNCQALSGA